MTIQALLAGEHREATAMFASKDGAWIPVPMGGGGGTPEPPRWVEMPERLGALSAQFAPTPVPGCTATFDQATGLLTVHQAAISAPGFSSSLWAIPLPAIDLTDDTTVVRVSAEVVQQNGRLGSNLDLILSGDAATVAGTSNMSTEPASMFTQEPNLFPVGTISTLGTSVQRQRQNQTGAPTAGQNYERQLVRVLAGPHPAIVVRVGNFNAASGDVTFVARLRLEKLVGAPADGGGGGTGEPNVGAPIGTVVSYVGSEAPEGWHLCDGTAHGSAALEALIGSPNAPDLRGRFLLAASAGHVAGATGGAETHTLTIAELPSHAHSGTTPTGALSGWMRGVFNSGGNLEGNHMITRGDGSTGFIDHPDGTQFPAHRHDIRAEGGGQPHNNMPPFYAIVFIIKTFTDAVAEHGFTREEATAQFVNTSGDTMTGNLTVPGVELVAGGGAGPGIGAILFSPLDDVFGVMNSAANGLARAQIADPLAANEAATKAYADDKVPNNVRVRGGIVNVNFVNGVGDLADFIVNILGLRIAIQGISFIDWGGTNGRVYSVINGTPATFSIYAMDVDHVPVNGQMAVSIIAIGT